MILFNKQLKLTMLVRLLGHHIEKCMLNIHEEIVHIMWENYIKEQYTTLHVQFYFFY